MADPFDKLVVRSHSPRKRAWLFGGLALLGVAFFYGMFELGRYDAGYRVVDAVRGALTSSERLRDLESENTRLKSLLEAADVARRVDREGYKQVERSLGDMQSQIARLNQGFAHGTARGMAWAMARGARRITRQNGRRGPRGQLPVASP